MQRNLSKGWNCFYSRTAIFCTQVLVLTLLCVACNQTRSDQSANLPNSTQLPNANSQQLANDTRQTGDELAVINMAIIPSQSSVEQEKNLQPLADYLASKLGRPFKFKTTKDFKSAVDLLVEGKVELAYLAPSTYVEARNRDPKVEPLVAPINRETGRPWYTSVIVASKSSGIKRVEDLKGKRFAFVDKLSTSGYMVPRVYFEDVGINPDRDFAGVIFSGGHDLARNDLVTGKVDAIANDKQAYLKQQKEGKIDPEKYNIIWESEPIPSLPIVASSRLSTPMKEALKKALIDAPEGLFDYTGAVGVGYTLVTDEDYDIIRKLQSRIKTIK